MSVEQIIADMIAHNEFMAVKAKELLDGMEESHPHFGILTQIVKDSGRNSQDAIWLERELQIANNDEMAIVAP